MENSTAESRLATAKTVLSTAASLAATAVVARSVAQDFLPPEFSDYVLFGIRNFFSLFSNQLTMVVDEFDGLVNNEIYEAAETYLGSKISPNTRRLKVTKHEKENNFVLAMERNEEIYDLFNGVKFKWVFACREVESKHFYNPRDMNSTLRCEVRAFELSFHKKYKDLVLHSYLPHIVKEAKTLKQETRTLKIFTVDYDNMYGNLADAWTPVNLDHPSTFDTLALDSKQRNMILNDLEMFVKRKEYYRKVGKAWKRGYLLYGPPGTGKSSLIAAMANYLNFDIYDLELTELKRNSDLRRLLVSTANRSILVVEDIDCTIELKNRSADASDSNSQENSKKEQVTLSGLLNFIDGLWSCCGDERIIVFTTNHKEKLDPALLRPGRMDVHVHLSYCSPCGFKLLAKNYLGVKEHELFGQIEELIGPAEVTPAEVAEELLKGSEPADQILKGLIGFLKMKIKEKEEANMAGNGQQESSVGEKGQSTNDNVEKKVDDVDK